MDSQKQETKFFEIKEAPLISKIFGVALRQKTIFTLWFKQDDVRIEACLFDISAKSDRLLLEVLPRVFGSLDEGDADEAKRLTEVLESHGQSPVFASFQVESAQFFIKTNYGGKAGETIVRLDFPDRIFKLQRRANVRIPFNRKDAPKLSLHDPKLTLKNDVISDANVLAYRVLDLSAGGVAIAAPVEDKERFSKGTRIRNIQFVIRGVQILTDGQVTYNRQVTSDRGKPILKVGIKFTGLAANFERVLVQFALDESRNLFSVLY